MAAATSSISSTQPHQRHGQGSASSSSNTTVSEHTWSQVVRKNLRGKGHGSKASAKKRDPQLTSRATKASGENSNTRDTAHGESESVSNQNSANKIKVQVSGARRVWGTLRESTVRSVKSVISRLCNVNTGIRIKRKTRTLSDKPQWWYVVHGDESVLSNLESRWDQVSVQTSCQLQPCYMYTDPESVAVNDNTEDTSAASEPVPIREHTPVETPSDPSTFNKEPATSITASQSPFEVIPPAATQLT